MFSKILDIFTGLKDKLILVVLGAIAMAMIGLVAMAHYYYGQNVKLQADIVALNIEKQNLQTNNNLLNQQLKDQTAAVTQLQNDRTEIQKSIDAAALQNAQAATDLLKKINVIASAKVPKDCAGAQSWLANQLNSANKKISDAAAATLQAVPALPPASAVAPAPASR
jgi:septal ring factor EnvC (AmiA/AmiB activator)